MEWKDARTLDEHIKNLLEQGKRGDHPDFQALFAAFGQVKIETKARKILSDLRGWKEREDGDDYADAYDEQEANKRR